MEMNSEIQPDNYPKPWQVLIVLLLTLFTIFVIGTIAFLVGGRKAALLTEAIIILPALFFTVRFDYSPKLLFRLRTVSFKLFFLSIALGVSLTVISDEIDRLIQNVITIPESFHEIYEKLLTINSVSDFIIVFFSAVILAAVLEEMLFRGFLQTSLENNSKIKTAIIITALIFAIFHAYPWVLIQIFIMGIVLGLMAWKSNSIIPSVIVHFINNGIAITFLNLKEDNYQWYLHGSHVSAPILIVALFILIFGLILFFQLCKSSSSAQIQHVQN